MRFVKFHGYGNDYIVCEAQEFAAEASSVGDFVRRVCDRHYGAGADGIAVVEKLSGEAADFHLHIFNADGSEAAMSGNGSRCAAAYLYYRGLWTGDRLRFATRAGIKLYLLREQPGPCVYRFEAEIGRPLFDSASIPMLTTGPRSLVRDYPLRLTETETVGVTALQMCNPNCCVFVQNFEATDWRRIGSLIEPHAAFPERTNVEFIRVHDRENIEVRVWERGVGETMSSGTGACASAVASIVNGKTGDRVSVRMPGGLLEVFRREDGEVLLTGNAELIYSGVWAGAGC